MEGFVLIILSYFMVPVFAVLFLWSWQHLADKLMETKTPRRRFIRFLILGSAIQLGLNVLSIHVPWLLAHVYGSYYFTIAAFTVQGILMVAMLYPHAYPPRAISAVALGYFFMFNALLVFDAFITNPVVEWYYERAASLEAYILVANLLSLGMHTAALFIGFAIGKLIDKTNFALYFGRLFTRRGRALVLCAVSLLLMHASCITLLCAPSLETRWFFVVVGILDILMLLAILFVAVFDSNREKVKAQETFIAQQQVYVQTLEGLQQDLRAFRHDYQNLLSGLYLQASEGDTGAIQATLKNTIHYFDERLGDQIHRVSELARVELPEVKSLLLVKLMQAEDLRVPVQLEIPRPITRLDMSSGDFLRCLGILADNALEAAAGTGGTVRIALMQDDAALAVVVANPCPEKPVLHKLGTDGYSTKGEGRGTGLASYRKLVQRHPNTATRTSHEGGVFRQELRIARP